MAQPTLPPWIQSSAARFPSSCNPTEPARVRLEGRRHPRQVQDPHDHDRGCAPFAPGRRWPPSQRARGAGASEAEIQEAVEVAYLFGGTPALRDRRQRLPQVVDARLEGARGTGDAALRHGRGYIPSVCLTNFAMLRRFPRRSRAGPVAVVAAIAAAT